MSTSPARIGRRWCPVGRSTRCGVSNPSGSQVKLELLLELFEEVLAGVAAVGLFEELRCAEGGANLPADARRTVTAHLMGRADRHVEFLTLLVGPRLAGDHRANASLQHREMLVLLRVKVLRWQVTGARIAGLHHEQLRLDRKDLETDPGPFEDIAGARHGRERNGDGQVPGSGGAGRRLSARSMRSTACRTACCRCSGGSPLSDA